MAGRSGTELRCHCGQNLVLLNAPHDQAVLHVPVPQVPFMQQNAIFFAQYADFDYNPAQSATDEFHRLCELEYHRWGRNKEEKKVAKQVAKQGFHDALTMQFNDNYGTDDNNITNWQALCARLHIDPVPDSLKECREEVRGKHVNLVDLVDTFGTLNPVTIFPTVFALSDYTMEHEKFFPKENAYAGNLLKFLLRQILRPELSENEGGRARGRGRGRGRGGRQGRPKKSASGTSSIIN